MKLTRMDLDGTGSPMGLVGKILKAEPELTIPVPIEELARQLDITDIRDMTTDGFEGGLVTDTARSSGYILVNRAARLGRRRFTVGHELGHFLMTHHKPPQGGFQCSRDDMRAWSDKEKSAGIRMEVEANEFSALILMPPPLWKRELGKLGDPDLSQIVALAKAFGVSKEAAARSFAQYHDEAVAIVVAKDGKAEKIYRKLTGFPTPCVKAGMNIPPSSFLFRATEQLDLPTEIVEARAEFWLESDFGVRLPKLYEQVFFQHDGYALIMLWAELPRENDFDPDEDRTSKQRLQDRQAKWAR
jgi:Zn-dependent peptidase ImmA (M78 family)